METTSLLSTTGPCFSEKTSENYTFLKPLDPVIARIIKEVLQKSGWDLSQCNQMTLRQVLHERLVSFPIEHQKTSMEEWQSYFKCIKKILKKHKWEEIEKEFTKVQKGIEKNSVLKKELNFIRLIVQNDAILDYSATEILEIPCSNETEIIQQIARVQEKSFHFCYQLFSHYFSQMKEQCHCFLNQEKRRPTRGMVKKAVGVKMKSTLHILPEMDTFIKEMKIFESHLKKKVSSTLWMLNRLQQVKLDHLSPREIGIIDDCILNWKSCEKIFNFTLTRLEKSIVGFQKSLKLSSSEKEKLGENNDELKETSLILSLFGLTIANCIKDLKQSEQPTFSIEKALESTSFEKALESQENIKTLQKLFNKSEHFLKEAQDEESEKLKKALKKSCPNKEAYQDVLCKRQECSAMLDLLKKRLKFCRIAGKGLIDSYYHELKELRKTLSSNIDIHEEDFWWLLSVDDHQEEKCTDANRHFLEEKNPSLPKKNLETTPSNPLIPYSKIDEDEKKEKKHDMFFPSITCGWIHQVVEKIKCADNSKDLKWLSEVGALMDHIIKKTPLKVDHQLYTNLEPYDQMRLKYTSDEAGDHAFLATCGVELFIKAILEQRLLDLGVIVPQLIIDLHIQLESLLDVDFLNSQKFMPHFHYLVDLSDYTEMKQHLNENLREHLSSLNYGLLWARCPKTFAEKLEKPPETLQILNFSILILEKIKRSDACIDASFIEQLHSLLEFVLKKQATSLEFILIYSKLKTTHLEELAFLEALQDQQVKKLKIIQQKASKALHALLGKKFSAFQTKTLPLSTAKLLESSEKLQHIIEINEEISIKLSNPILPLKESLSYLLRLSAAIPMFQNYPDSHLTAWHFRNLLMFQWLFEYFYRSQCTAREIDFDQRNHYFNQFYESLSQQQHLDKEFPKTNAKFHQELKHFNYGKGAHYHHFMAKWNPSCLELESLLKLLKESKEAAKNEDGFFEISQATSIKEWKNELGEPILKKGISLINSFLEELDQEFKFAKNAS